ncbi:alpha-hydroxy acid oxidase [Caldimonas caldifontis]|uniref:Alpha-hydroxy-acid oxidizing enzyme n=1 Tax=Caldimonas caldifontis TaxID=1452508 RepID=A0A2S5SQP4_9BURK|nr:alpha-hydroxy acid oxidase [Caldimonas caldifontis]PPE65014.1 alpha-hydroxy-acid oxidizing enzyme [Caldimonas caldifontis]
MSAAAVSPADYEALAQARLDANAWAYVSGGAGDEHTVRANRAAWDALCLQPRVLCRTAGGHTRRTLLGRTLAHPILLAPVAHQRLAHPDGELATAYAAAALGAGMVLSLQSNTPVEAVAQAMHGETEAGPLWMQLYPQTDRGFWRELVQRAEAAGCEALVLTVDAPVSGARDRERRAGFRLPPGVSAVHLAGRPSAVASPAAPGRSALFDDLLQAAPTWDDVDWLCATTRLPVLLKGVMHPADAREALGHGVAGLIVSNHGGRTLDTAAPTAQVLPAVLAAVGGRLPVLVDGGIRRGTDVFKALALGASAVLVGRPQVWALAAGGAQGVAHLLRLLRDELEIAMALCGCATLDAITPELLLDPLRA